MLQTTEIIQPKFHENVRNFKYKGQDNSIYYKYFVSPLCEKIVLFFPLWLSPNIITLTGLVCNIIAFLICYSFNGFAGGEEIPGFWIHIIGILHVTYYYIDNLDGKQARRTANSTPLGTIMDHVCDSITTFLITAILGSIVGMVYLWEYTFIWFMIIIPFYSIIWEENINKFFYLPEISVAESNLTTIIVIHWFGFFGRGIFQVNMSIFGYEILSRYFAVYFMFTCGFLIFLCSFLMTLHKHWNKKWEILSLWRSFIYLAISLIFLCYKAKDSIIISKYPILVLLAFGPCFSVLAAKMLLKTIKDQDEFEQDTLSSNVFYFLCLLACFLKPFTGVQLIDAVLIFGLIINNIY